MGLRKSPPALVQAFASALPKDRLVERRTMFGFPAAFVNGNLFCGLHQEDVLVRLPPERREELAKAGGSRWEPTPGRVMREYMLLPRDASATDLKRWLRLSLSFAKSLPVKSSATWKSKSKRGVK